MALPSIATPEFITKIPSTGQEIRYRPFLVKEEKILLMALEGKDSNEIMLSVQNVLKNCILSEDVSVNKLATFDIEYLFLKLRSKSVGEVIKIKVNHANDSECKYATEVDINIDKINVEGDIKDGKLMLTDKVGLKLRYPTMEDLKGISIDDAESMFKMVRKCIEFIFDEDNVYSDFTEKELSDWIDSLNQTQFAKITQFFEGMPKLSHKIDWECKSCGKNDSVTVEGLQGFFI